MPGGSLGDLFVGLRADSTKLIDDLKTGGTKAGQEAGTSFGARFKTAMTTGGFGSFVKGGFGLAAGMAVFGALTRGIGQVTDFLGDAVKAAMEDEASVKLLTEAIKQNDLAWDGNYEAIAKRIEAGQDLAFSDDAQRDSLRSLVSVTGDATKALDIQRTAMDLARLKGIDLGTATTLLGKVYAGNMGVLSRYGIQLEKGATATEALAEIQRRAAGQAATYATTTAGKMERAQIQMGEATEALGYALLPVAAAFADFAADVIPDIADAIGNLGDAFNNLNRFLNSDVALWQDLEELVPGLAAKMGVPPEVLQSWADSRKATFDQIAVYKALEEKVRAEIAATDEYTNFTLANLTGATESQIKMALSLGGTTQEQTDRILALSTVTKDQTEAEQANAAAMAEGAKVTAEASARLAVLGGLKGQVTAATEEMTQAIVDDWTWAGQEITAVVGKWPESFKSTILGGREQLEAAMMELRWAMERPFADDAFAKWLAARAREATSMMAKALRQGRPALVAEAAAIRIDLLEQLNIMDPGAGTQAALRQRQREMEGDIGGGGGRIRSSKPKDRKQDTADETGFTSAVIGTATATDKRTASVDRSTAADKKHEEAIKAKEKALKAEQAAAERLSAAFDYMADSSMPDLQAESTAALEALRLSLEAQVDPLQTLRDEEAALAALRAQAMEQHRYDVVAAIDQRQEEIDLQQKQIKLISERYAMEDAALDRIQSKMGVSIERARELLELYRGKEKYEDYTDKELAGVIIRKRAAGGPVTGGMPYWVGEKGPELVVPRTDSTVVPSGAAGSQTVRVELAPGTGHELAVAGMTEGGFASMLAGILRGSTAQPRYGWSG